MKQIKLEDIKSFRKTYNKDKYNKIIENAITNNGVNEVALDQNILNENQMVFNIKLPKSKIRDQKASGRCWCFACLNFLKYNIANNMNIKIEDIELSANYLTFYDKFEKMNSILEEVLSLKKYDFDILNDLEITNFFEGGCWNFFKDLIQKYGVIPASYMRENKVTEGSAVAREIINAKVKRDIYTLLEAKKKKKTKEEIEKLTKKMMSDNYTLLCKLFGEPPEKINLEYMDKDSKLVSQKLTPQEFFKKYCTINLDDYVTVGSVEMYNKEYYKRYERKVGESVFGLGKDEIVNIPKDEFKELVIKQLKDNSPVFFGAEVTKMFNLINGIFDTRIYNYEELFDFKPLTQEEGLNLKYYKCCHGMCMVGVHLDKNKPVRWKVENSWGEKDTKGYCVMNDNYFDKFVMEATINKKYLTAKQLKAAESKPIDMDASDPA